ncbi:MAG: preprotein translocase subunit SecG [Pyrinomonadaceae bacterium]
MLTYVLYTIYIFACLVLVLFVLLQPGKADAGALFSSSISSTAFGPRGTQTLLAKITIGAAITFMLVALILSLPVVLEKRSVLQSQPGAAATPTPAPTPIPTPPTPLAAPNASAIPTAAPTVQATPVSKTKP